MRRPPRSPPFPYTTLFRSHLGVNRIDRHRLDLDQEIAPSWPRLLDIEVDQRLVLIDGQRAVIADGHRSGRGDRKSTRLNSSHQITPYPVFSLQTNTPPPPP